MKTLLSLLPSSPRLAGPLVALTASLAFPLAAHAECLVPESNPPGLPEYPFPCPMQMAKPMRLELHRPPAEGAGFAALMPIYMKFEGIEGESRTPASDGGEDQTGTGTLQITLHCPQGTSLTPRVLSFPVQVTTHSGPRVAGAVQSFATELRVLGGEITTDPDFSLIRVRAGAGLGLPVCPGQATLVYDDPATISASATINATLEIQVEGRAGTPWAPISGKGLGQAQLSLGETRFGGLDITALGAGVPRVKQGELVVSNIGSSGNDGVSMQVPNGGSIPGLKLTPNISLNGHTTIKASHGDEAGTARREVGMVVGHTPAGYEAGASFPDAQSAMGAQNVRISIYNGPSRVAVYDAIIICITDPCPTWPLGSQMGRVLLPNVAGLSCGVRVATGDVNGDGVADLAVVGSEMCFAEWSTPAMVDISDDGLPAVQGTRVEWLATPLAGPARGFSKFDVTGGGSDTLVIGGTEITDGCGGVKPVGSAFIGGPGIVGGCQPGGGGTRERRLSVSNIGSSGQDGVEISWKRPGDAARIKIEIPDGNPSPYNPFPAESTLALGASGGGGGTGLPQSFGQMEALHLTPLDGAPFDVQYLPPTGAPAAFEMRAAVYNDGQLQGSLLMLATQPIKTTRIGGSPAAAKPQIVSMEFRRQHSPLRPYFSVIFDRPIPITPTGSAGWTGNELRLYPTALAGSAVSDVSSLLLTGRGLSTVALACDQPETFPGASSQVLANPVGSATAFSYPPPDRLAVERTLEISNAAGTKGMRVRCECTHLRVSSIGSDPLGNQIISCTSDCVLTIEGAGAGGLGSYKRTFVIPHILEFTRQTGVQGTHIKEAMLVKRFQAILPPGDPDFDLLRISCGSDLGLADATGELTASLTLPGVMDVCYSLDAALEVSVTGKQGSLWAGFSESHVIPSRLYPSANPAGTRGSSTALGSASLDPGSTGGSGLVVSNIGSSGQDGVSVNFGKVEGYDLTFDPFTLQTGGHIEVSSWSWGESNAGSVQVSRPTASPGLQADVDFSHIGATDVIMELYNGQTFVGTTTIPGQTASILISGIPPGTPPPLSSIGKIGPRSGTSCVRVRFASACSFTVTGQPTPVGEATEMRLLALGSTFSGIDHAEVRCAGVTGGALSIASKAVQVGGCEFSFTNMLQSIVERSQICPPVCGSSGLGAFAIDPPATGTGGCFDMWENSNQVGRIHAGTFNGGPGTITLQRATSTGLAVRTATVPVTLSQNGSSFVWEPICPPVGGTIPIPYPLPCRLQRGTGDTTLSADFSSIGVTQVHVVISQNRGGQKELELDTVLTADELTTLASIADASCCYPPQVISSSAAIYWGFHQPGVSDPCMKLTFARVHPITVGGTTVQGDTVEILAITTPASPPITGFSGANITIGGDNIVEIDEVFEIGRWAHGLDTHGLGGASLGYSPLDRRLLVSNLGSSGQDGVSVNLGRADGWDAHFDPITTGGVMVHAFGDTDTASNVLLGRMACSPGWTNLRPACWGADFTALGAATVTVDVYDGDTHTGQFTMPAGAAAMIQPLGPGGIDPDLVRVSKLPTQVGSGAVRPPGFALEFSNSGNIMPPGGGQAYVGSRVHLSAQPAGDVVVSVNTIEVRPGLVWAAIECPAVPVTITSQGLVQSEKGTKTAFPEVAYKGISQPGIKRCVSLGNGHLQGNGPCRVRVGNIGSSGEDGVSIVDLDTDGLVAFANREAAVPAYSEIVVRARGRTTAVPPVSDAPLGEVHLFNDSGAQGGHFTADFSILGAPQVRVIVVRGDGTTVGEFTVAAGTPVPIIPETSGEPFHLVGCGKLPGGVLRTPCFFMQFDPIFKVKVTVPGTGAQLLGSEIRYLAQGGTVGIVSIDQFDIAGTNLPPFEISSASATGFSGWLGSHFSTAEIADPAISALTADPDLDGRTNALEYATGTDPRSGGHGGGSGGSNGDITQEILTGGGAGPHIKLSLHRPSGLSGVTTTVQVSDTLQFWSPGPAPVQILPLPNGEEELIYELPYEDPSHFSRFRFVVRP